MRRLHRLATQLRRRQRRWHRRSGRPHRTARRAALARGRRPLARPHPPLAQRRLRLRRERPSGRAPRLRHDGRLPQPARRAAPARHAPAARSGHQPHERAPPLVSRLALEPNLCPARLVLLACAAQRLGEHLRRPRLDAGRSHGRVLPAPLLSRAARPRLEQPGGAPGACRDRPLLAGRRRRRLSFRRPHRAQERRRLA